MFWTSVLESSPQISFISPVIVCAMNHLPFQPCFHEDIVVEPKVVFCSLHSVRVHLQCAEPAGLIAVDLCWRWFWQMFDMKRLGFDHDTGSVVKACMDLIRLCCSGPGLSVSFSLSQIASRNTAHFIIKSCFLALYTRTFHYNNKTEHFWTSDLIWCE